jgi:coenzyme F420-reducing hydrogenase delta subunit
MKIIRVMCTGRVDMAFIFRSFLNSADGVLVGGCWPGECHYVTEGNYDALANMMLCKKLLSQIGINPERLRLEWVAASEGARFAEVMNDFVKKQKELGSLGKSEEIETSVLNKRLQAAQKLVPYIKLVERERLRVPLKSEQAYQEYYESDEVNRLFDELITDKLKTSQILSLLEMKPLSTREISESLGLDPSIVSRHMNESSRQGLVSYDTDQNQYTLISGNV